MMRKFAGTICVILSILIAAGFIYHYGPIFMDYKKSSDLYDGLKDDYTNDGRFSGNRCFDVKYRSCKK